jgi:hypothetical protein
MKAGSRAGRAKLRRAVKRAPKSSGRKISRPATYVPVEALDAKGSYSESASVQTTMKIERRESLEKPNVPVEMVGASRRRKPGREESVLTDWRHLLLKSICTKTLISY